MILFSGKNGAFKKSSNVITAGFTKVKFRFLTDCSGREDQAQAAEAYPALQLSLAAYYFRSRPGNLEVELFMVHKKHKNMHLTQGNFINNYF